MDTRKLLYLLDLMNGESIIDVIAAISIRALIKSIWKRVHASSNALKRRPGFQVIVDIPIGQDYLKKMNTMGKAMIKVMIAEDRN